MSDTYRIVRHYFNGPPYRRTIETGLSLEQAQAHCQNKDISSSTGTSASARKRTRERGPWFDGYEQE